MSLTSTGSNIVIVDYGLGNLFSMERAFRQIGEKPSITSDIAEIKNASALVLPGVGAFRDGMQRLTALGLIDSIHEAASLGKPVFGICLGMQLLFQESAEFGYTEGLGLIDGKVIRLSDHNSIGKKVKVPHIGWNSLHPVDELQTWNATLLDGVSFGESSYFVHSFVPEPTHSGVTIAKMSYGDNWYCAVVEQSNVFGVQFHPEKSSYIGLQILTNFSKEVKSI